MACVETQLPIWTAPDDLQEEILRAWWERRKEDAQRATEAATEAALSRR